MTGEYSTLDFCFLFLFIKDRDKILIAKNNRIPLSYMETDL